jgi:hypothetical protein
MRSKTLAAALIVLTFLGTGGWTHVEGDDPDFLPAGAHNHSAHHESFRAPVAPDSNAHCAVCHWLQMFRASALRHVRVQFVSTSHNVRVAAAVPSLRSAALLDVPSRAPPA